MRFVPVLLTLLFLAPPVRAGGTLPFTDLVPLLKRRPELGAFLFQAYELPDSAFAVIRVGSHFAHLGGRRLGPYLFEARSRLGRERGSALISLCTRHRFLDRAGAVIPADTDRQVLAHSVSEELTAVVIRDPTAMAAGDGCPPSGAAAEP